MHQVSGWNQDSSSRSCKQKSTLDLTRKIHFAFTVAPSGYPSVMQDTVTETKDSNVEMASPDSPSVELPAFFNNPPTSSSTGAAPNLEDHERILEKMKSLTSHCQHYIELAYSTHLNAFNIKAYDHRIGTILLALLGLVAQRRIYSKQHQGYADQMAATLQ
ncbi:hypothetical protein H1R20_g10180, partial [Candolleomyces eurysporus]